ncbi:MAG: sigma-54 dependent transcriptional regulator [Proteobacteria bacterium]|nr:sigma-54 dependent transcriptional regulator [Pseudomonadota bacterium]
MAKILIVDDDTMLVNALGQVLASMGHSTDGAATLAEGLEMARGNGYELVILDVRLPDGNGLEALPRFREGPGAPEVIILTGVGDPDGAELAIRSGAWSYITKPPTMNNIRLPVERAVEYRRNKDNNQHKPLVDHGVLGESSAIRACLRKAAQAAGCDAAVLITGDTGTGKELVARAIHDNSHRKAGSFVVVDCAALPENLVESMLFGHEKGSFTGADRRSQGLVLQADGGTLFLDEVGELPLGMQRAFLRVLQDHRFRPVGGSREVSSDFRLLAATNKDLEQRVPQGLFREDLLFRIRGLSIILPPLVEREDDVQLLAGHFLARFCGSLGIVPKGMSKDFLDALRRYGWPGNVRELMGAMEHALASAEGEPNLLSRHLPTNIRVAVARAGLGDVAQPQTPAWSIGRGEFPSLQDFRDSHLADLERFYLEELMRTVGWKMAQAIDLSGLSRARLYALLKKYGVSRPRRPLNPGVRRAKGGLG